MCVCLSVNETWAPSSSTHRFSLNTSKDFWCQFFVWNIRFNTRLLGFGWHVSSAGSVISGKSLLYLLLAVSQYTWNFLSRNEDWEHFTEFPILSYRDWISMCVSPSSQPHASLRRHASFVLSLWMEWVSEGGRLYPDEAMWHNMRRHRGWRSGTWPNPSTTPLPKHPPSGVCKFQHQMRLCCPSS